jgi:hypothetical protein
LKASDIARLQGVGLTHLPPAGGQVAEYRACIIDKDGQFLGAIELMCTGDETAKQFAKQLVDGHDAELWQQDRQIAKFPS